MAYKIDYDDNRKIAELTFNNPTSLDEKKRARSEVDGICKCQKAKRVLLDMAEIITTGNLQILDLYEFGSTWQYNASFGKIRYAIVLPCDRKSKDDIDFLITVGLNRGAFIKGFHHRDEAIDWLMNKISL